MSFIVCRMLIPELPSRQVGEHVYGPMFAANPEQWNRVASRASVRYKTWKAARQGIGKLEPESIQ